MSPNPKLTESPIPMKPTPLKPTNKHTVAQSTSADNSQNFKNKVNNQSNHQCNSHAETETDQTDTYSESYFDALYSDNTDPWQYQTRWYEKRKRDICLAVLPKAQYSSAIELGCGNGVFSELLAQRCQALLSIDGNNNAVQLARQRLQSLSHAKVIQGVIPKVLNRLESATLQAFPDALPIVDEPSSTRFNTSNHSFNHPFDKPFNHRFDLIVISEILYYLAPKDIDTVIEWIKQNLAVGGTLLCCHWRYDIDGFEMNGDTVHHRLQQALTSASHSKDLKPSEPHIEPKSEPKTQPEPKSTFTHQTQLVERDFLLDVWINSPQSVAMQENLV